ncbi:hypothetical protein DL98DRAFT_523323 [Cadophora sp. DSE1049]|nr:hypothetical protein DL98DRAFT_523323 [Cadophora sp. DSE1049]
MNATYSRAIRASQGQSKMPESGFAEGSESIESGGAASGGCLPILEISGFKGSVFRVKLKIRRSWDPFWGATTLPVHGTGGVLDPRLPVAAY